MNQKEVLARIKINALLASAGWRFFDDDEGQAEANPENYPAQSGPVVTWSHVHLHGEYDFSEEKLRDSKGYFISFVS